MKSYIETKNCKLSKSVLSNVQDISYSSFMKALRKKDIKVNGKRVSKDIEIVTGDKIEIYYISTDNSGCYDLIYYDENILVINKKQGYLSEAVFEKICERFSNAKFIHRLDRNTKGLMIFALNERAEKELMLGFKNRTFDKKYHALVKGCPKENNNVLIAYLVKDKEASTVKIYSKKVEGSVMIKTGYEIIEKYKDSSLLEITLFTGKTHQIRAHLAFIGHPVVGDGKYGDFEFNKQKNLKAQELTAKKITLRFDKKSPLYYLNEKTFSI